MWVYPRGTWDPQGWLQHLIYFGGDEFHRRTLVIPWFTGYLVIALWRFNGVDESECEECNS